MGNKTSDAIWNQLFVGASESCSEANVQLSLMDIFFQHQRGAVLGSYMLAISAGTYLGPLVASYIAANMGWRWIGWFRAILSGLLAIVVFFGLEETAFDRNAHLLVDGINTTDSTEETSHGHEFSDATKEKMTSELKNARDVVPNPVATAGKTYCQRIALITLAPNVRGTGFKQYFSRLFHALRVFTFPAV